MKHWFLKFRQYVLRMGLPWRMYTQQFKNRYYARFNVHKNDITTDKNG